MLHFCLFKCFGSLASSCVIPRQPLFPIAIIDAPLVGWNKINPKLEHLQSTFMLMLMGDNGAMSRKHGQV